MIEMGGGRLSGRSVLATRHDDDDDDDTASLTVVQQVVYDLLSAANSCAEPATNFGLAYN